MALCSKCGKDLKPGVTFCESCGARAEGVTYEENPVKKIVKISVPIAVIAIIGIVVWNMFFSGLRIGTFVDNWNSDMEKWKAEGSIAEGGYTDKMFVTIDTDVAEIEKVDDGKIYKYRLAKIPGDDEARIMLHTNNYGKVNAMRLEIGLNVVDRILDENSDVDALQAIHIKALSAFNGEKYDYDETVDFILELWNVWLNSDNKTQEREMDGINVTISISEYEGLVLEVSYE